MTISFTELDNVVDKDDGIKTSLSLLSGLRARDPEAWNRLVHLYGPLVLGWCRRHNLQQADASDIAQEVFRTVLLRIADFHKNSEHAEFRAWLRAIFRNKLGDLWRRMAAQPQAEGGMAPGRFDELAEDDSDDDDSGESTALFRRAFDLIRGEFEETSWQAFWLVVCENRKPADVALELRVSLNAVYVAKSRVLRRLRETLGDLPEE